MLALGDRQFLQLLRHHGAMTVQELAQASSLTDTAVRHRLNRLMAQGLVERQESHKGRGRPSHQYFLTEQARILLGQNYAELARVLWEEVRALDDRSVAAKLLKRVANRLARSYQRQMPGQTLGERLDDLYHLLSGRGIDIEVLRDRQLPVLRQHSCPYHKLAELDRSVCGMEKLILERALDSQLRLTQCRLDGAPCCEFHVLSATATDSPPEGEGADGLSQQDALL